MNDKKFSGNGMTAKERTKYRVVINDLGKDDVEILSTILTHQDKLDINNCTNVESYLIYFRQPVKSITESGNEINKIGKFDFIEAWKFPDDVQSFIHYIFNRLQIDEQTVCHCFSGKSTIGGLTVDIEEKNNPDLVADVRDLPDILHEETQEHILADPPWSIPFSKRRAYSYAMRDICKTGGYLIINSPWVPWVKGLQLIGTWEVAQRFNSYRDVVFFRIYRKIGVSE